jgi:hypothetical protein
MTRKERQKRLQELWKKKQIDDNDLLSSWTSWQGAVAAALSYNPKLQSDFKEAVKAAEERENSGFDSGFRNMRKHHRRIANIFSEAIYELELPEEPKDETVSNLTDEHGLKWFWSHSTRGSRWAIALLFLTSLAAAFGIGWRVGATRIGSTLYNQYNIDDAPIPSSAATEHHPTIRPASMNTTDALTKSLFQPTASPSASITASATPQISPK